jgi:hypothetical protein
MENLFSNSDKKLSKVLFSVEYSEILDGLYLLVIDRSEELTWSKKVPSYDEAEAEKMRILASVTSHSSLLKYLRDNNYQA